MTSRIYGNLGQLSRDDLTFAEHAALMVIGAVYNGALIDTSDGRYQLGVTEFPRSLQSLVEQALADQTLSQMADLEQAVSDLIGSHLTREERIFHRDIGWAPTRPARQYIDTHYDPETHLSLPHHLTLRDGHGLVGDPDESLRHRLGVETGVRYGISAPTPYMRVVTYPHGPGEAGTDLQLFNDEGDEYGGEVVTKYTSDRHLQQKGQTVIQRGVPTFVIGDNRTTVNKALNIWVKDDDLAFDLPNFPLAHPEDRALSEVRQYIRRSEMTGELFNILTITPISRTTNLRFLNGNYQ